MAKIYVLMGKSASGKDTLYERLLADPELALKKVIPYTTRPIRSGEQQGREYYFVDEAELERLRAEGRVIEHREYRTVHGPWHYFTVDDGQIDPSGTQDCLMIDTLEGYRQLASYFGRERTIPLYIEVEDGLRLTRALAREQAQEQPKYRELCRRFLADCEDFSEEKLAEAGITRRFFNLELEQCLQELSDEIRSAALPRSARHSIL
ncbi:MAG: guanylate kinase [Lachnospiraceae bacterium]|nr:guanylate kinase [Lachnospiraceae bacterium]